MMEDFSAVAALLAENLNKSIWAEFDKWFAARQEPVRITEIRDGDQSWGRS